jgi:hypothetical protein
MRRRSIAVGLGFQGPVLPDAVVRRLRVRQYILISAFFNMVLWAFIVVNACVLGWQASRYPAFWQIDW